jgi:hypothetical protein
MIRPARLARVDRPAGAIERPQRHLVDAQVRELASWLETPDRGDRTVVASWSPRHWSAFRRVVAMHGLAPHLVLSLPSSTLADLVPTDTFDWLAEQDGLNRRRIERMHGDLAAILGAAATAGIEVMPLKGALLTTMPGADASRRPMADLDLLVHPADRAGLGAVLEALGYRHAPEANPRPTHDVYLDPGGGRVVSFDGEHPDNPRRVEVHVEVVRHLWGWVDDDDLTAALWIGARSGEVLGRPATIPRPEALFAHLAIHASSDLLVGRGRLVQWLDLARLAPRAGDLTTMPHPRLAYPALRLAARALPDAMAGVDLHGLVVQAPDRLVRWATTVPLDHRCGLTTGRPPTEPSGFGARWERWRPDPWRLAVAYGDAPLPIALARHARTVIARTRDRGVG